MAEESKKYWIQLDEQNFITSWSDNEIPNAVEVSNCDEWYSRCYVVKYENGKFSFNQTKSDELEIPEEKSELERLKEDVELLKQENKELREGLVGN